jgi:hypothetical protein
MKVQLNGFGEHPVAGRDMRIRQSRRAIRLVDLLAIFLKKKIKTVVRVCFFAICFSFTIKESQDLI